MSNLSTLSNVTLIPTDVTDTSSINATVTVVEKATGGRLDYLVNNAGIAICQPLLGVNIVDAKKYCL
ncbi:hypothetical protein BGW36DRAFT_431783 [Talaromyces proteolyticus]|uniref:Uncharacterized protein n=1 Tax=Talaromyces proteolyticus TaxID=1131652 RepID=A0AAD4KLH3_9EURO|nr:uncharacterized protein BGW36DRAFT_431783 [Talaromyces proteolyticus]KAH8691227.1 hypothetical protein BGW36DRAFT_431783 [Talaromyces proteolyticus]